MKSIITASAALALFAFAAGNASAATSDAAITGASSLPAAVGTPATEPQVRLAHGFHLDCRAGPRRGWIHRNGFWSAGLPTVIGCR